MNRARRSLDEDPRFGYTRANPWSAVFAACLKEAKFWAREVTTPATLLLARNKALQKDLKSVAGESSPEKKAARQEPAEEEKEEAHW